MHIVNHTFSDIVLYACNAALSVPIAFVYSNAGNFLWLNLTDMMCISQHILRYMGA